MEYFSDDFLRLVGAITCGCIAGRFICWLPNAILRSYVVYKQMALTRQGGKR